MKSFELFTDIFTIKPNRLSVIETRCKLLCALIAIMCVLFSESPLFPTILFAISMTATLMVGVPAKMALLRFVLPLVMATTLLIVKALLTGSTPMVVFDFYLFSLIFTLEGFTEGALIASRVLGALGVVHLLSVITPAHDIFRTALWLGLPREWVEVAMMMYRYIFELLDTVVEISSAQRTRLGYSTAWLGLNSAGTVAGSALVRSFDKAVATSEAMTARGYDGVIRFDPPEPVTSRDVMIAGATTLGIVSMFLLTGIS